MGVQDVTCKIMEPVLAKKKTLNYFLLGRSRVATVEHIEIAVQKSKDEFYVIASRAKLKKH